MTARPHPADDHGVQTDARRRLVYVSNSAPGEYTGRFRWIEPLRARGYDVAFALPTGQPWHVEQMRSAGVTVHTYPVQPRSANPWQDLRSAFLLARILAAEHPVLVHSFGHKANVHALLARQWVRRPAFVLHVTGLGSPFVSARSHAREKLVRWTLRRAYHVGARQGAGILFENDDDPAILGHRSPRRGEVACASGVDPDAFDPRRVPAADTAEVRHELGLTQDDLVLTFVGRLLPEKGLTNLLAAVDCLATSYPQLRVLVVGPGYERQVPPLVRPSKTRGGVVRWLGRREDVREILAVTSIFVNPSYREGFSRANLEAAAMGVPLVTSDVPGCRELVREAPCGLLVPPRDAKALASAIARLAGDAALREQMGRAGRELVQRRYTVQHVVERIDAIYRCVLGGPP